MQTGGAAARPADATDGPTPVAEVVAPAAWRAIDFISDLHLAPEMPRTFGLWADYLDRSAADAIFILGDLFEAWPGDDARFEGFEATCAAVLKQAAARRFVAFLQGNRDFMLGTAMLADCGVHSLDDPTVLEAFGTRTLLTHGDAWCLADVPYLQVRAQVRNPAWQAAMMTQSLPQRRALARQLRLQSEAHASTRSATDWADVDAPLARRWLEVNAATTLIHGHTHRPGSETIGPGLTRHVLSDWDLDHDASQRAEVLRWQADGFARIAPADAARSS